MNEVLRDLQAKRHPRQNQFAVSVTRLHAAMCNADSNPVLIPEGPRKILRDYCSDCHSQSNQEADINRTLRKSAGQTEKEQVVKVLFNNQHA